MTRYKNNIPSYPRRGNNDQNTQMSLAFSRTDEPSQPWKVSQYFIDHS